MFEARTRTMTDTLGNPETLMRYCAAFAALLLFGVAGLRIMRDRTADRVRAVAGAMRATGMRPLTKGDEIAPSGWKKALIPEDPSERMQIRFQLEKLGSGRPDVVEIFFLIRLFLALVTPVAVVCTLALVRAGLMPDAVVESLNATPPLARLWGSTAPATG